MFNKPKKLALRLTQGTKGSQSAKRLAEGLSTKLGYKVFRTTKDSLKQVQLKYGQGVDKLTQFQWFQTNNIPALDFTTSKDQADSWIHDGHVVFGRQLLSASCGHGIVVLEGCEFQTTPDCPVYTKYKKKKREFRVHVFRDSVVAVVEKKLRSNWNGPRESKIRNLANGYVFCHCENEPDGLRELAKRAAGVVHSDFKGVDIGFNEKQNELFVIEVNSAPGIEGSNVNKYISAICEA